MTEQEWLQQLKAGDEVFVTQRWGEPSPYKVVKTTATQVEVERYGRFRKKDGYQIGGSKWHSCRLLQPTQERKDAAEVQALRARATRMNEHVQIPKDKKGLQAFIAALEPFMGQPC